MKRRDMTSALLDPCVVRSCSGHSPREECRNAAKESVDAIGSGFEIHGS